VLLPDLVTTTVFGEPPPPELQAVRVSAAAESNAKAHQVRRVR
jgi:hypothetical protein